MDNTHPDNLLLMATPQVRRTFWFMPGTCLDAKRLGLTTPPTATTPTTHQDAAHSETPADRATDQDNDPDEFEFDL